MIFEPYSIAKIIPKRTNLHANCCSVQCASHCCRSELLLYFASSGAWTIPQYNKSTSRYSLPHFRLIKWLNHIIKPMSLRWHTPVNYPLSPSGPHFVGLKWSRWVIPIYKMKSSDPSYNPGCLQNVSLQGIQQRWNFTKTALQNEGPGPLAWIKNHPYITKHWDVYFATAEGSHFKHINPSDPWCWPYWKGSHFVEWYLKIAFLWGSHFVGKYLLP